jgi:hypothetical protein
MHVEVVVVVEGAGQLDAVEEVVPVCVFITAVPKLFTWGRTCDDEPRPFIYY